MINQSIIGILGLLSIAATEAVLYVALIMPVG
jgi:hypothetical protein